MVNVYDDERLLVEAGVIGGREPRRIASAGSAVRGLSWDTVGYMASHTQAKARAGREQ